LLVVVLLCPHLRVFGGETHRGGVFRQLRSPLFIWVRKSNRSAKVTDNLLLTQSIRQKAHSLPGLWWFLPEYFRRFIIRLADDQRLPSFTKFFPNPSSL